MISSFVRVGLGALHADAGTRQGLRRVQYVAKCAVLAPGRTRCRRPSRAVPSCEGWHCPSSVCTPPKNGLVRFGFLPCSGASTATGRRQGEVRQRAAPQTGRAGWGERAGARCCSINTLNGEGCMHSPRRDPVEREKRKRTRSNALGRTRAGSGCRAGRVGSRSR